ncbi:hypothetical protein CV102_16890 [Natronococcus pandeyae]|uniref:Uncharacterized protein n=1 Tax=Natronococcus pandeyae TaxID=2055836 RepID=A0A8J8Q400_9EURY|nr:hypothetical protein [Natronococcus pandeyae]TYL37304.1 hypothetical protein CV102_16890 [Natronococcus pandeyae]
MKLHFVKATGVFLRTLPFVALRIAVGALFGILTVLYFGVIGWLVLTLLEAGTLSGPIAGVGLVIATLIFLGVMRLARRYVLYLVAAGHIAVIAYIVDTGETPSNQIAFGTNKVKENFAGASALFVVDQLVKSVIRQFNSTVISLSNLVSFVPTLGNILTVLRRAIALAASYIDEAILAHVFLNEDQNNWRAARDGVVLYGKTWKPVLASTLIIVLGMYAVAFAMLLALTPLAAVFGGFSPTFEVLGWVVVGGIALTVYLGVLRPWVKTVVITTFLVESRDATPDSETMDFIANRSKKFEELVANAEAEKSDDALTGEVAESELPNEEPI